MRYLTVILIACLAWLGTALDAYPSEPGRTPRPDAHEPGPKNPFGSRHPEAPAEISQYEFMIGEWSCTERFRQADGSWSEFDSLVRSRYFLNGNAIMNQTFLPDSAAAMTYQFNPEASSWAITNTRAPGFSKTEWVGQKVGDTMVASRESTNQAGAAITLSITFFNIAPSSFNWKLAATSAAGTLVVREKNCLRTNGEQR